MRQQKLYWMIRLVVLFVVLIGVSSIDRQTAVAQVVTSDRWATWEVAVDFPKDQLYVELIVTAGYYDVKEERSVVRAKPLELKCEERGSIVIKNGVATFPGDAYFSCLMPDIAEIAADITNGQVVIGSYCDCKDPWATGIVSPDPLPVQAEPFNPIFYRDDIQLGVPIQGGGEKARLEFAVDTVSVISAPFPLNRPNYDFFARFEPDPNIPNRFQPIFELNRINLPAFPNLVNQQLSLSTAASMIYIGYDPVDNVYFEGEIEDLNVDPACFGVG